MYAHFNMKIMYMYGSKHTCSIIYNCCAECTDVYCKQRVACHSEAFVVIISTSASL